MSKLESQVENYIRHGVVPVKWAEPEPPRSIVMPDTCAPLRAEIAKLTQALGDCAIALDCMEGLSTRQAYHRDHARQLVREAIGS